MKTLNFDNGYTFEITRTRGIFGTRYKLTILAWGYKLTDEIGFFAPLYTLREIMSMARSARHLQTATARG